MTGAGAAFSARLLTDADVTAAGRRDDIQDGAFSVEVGVGREVVTTLRVLDEFGPVGGSHNG
jgi:hypothetical protein